MKIIGVIVAILALGVGGYYAWRYLAPMLDDGQAAYNEKKGQDTATKIKELQRQYGEAKAARVGDNMKRRETLASLSLNETGANTPPDYLMRGLENVVDVANKAVDK